MGQTSAFSTGRRSKRLQVPLCCFVEACTLSSLVVFAVRVSSTRLSLENHLKHSAILAVHDEYRLLQCVCHTHTREAQRKSPPIQRHPARERGIFEHRASRGARNSRGSG